MTTTATRSWKGIFPSLPTPFAADGSLDLAGMRATVRFAMEAGAHGLVGFGLAGEVNRLTPAERLELAAVIIDEGGGRVPVLLGAGAEATHTAVGLAKAFERMGASGIVIASPTQTALDEALLEEHFVAIARATALPVTVQEASAYLGVRLSPELLLRVADRCPTIAYVKIEAGPDETALWVDRLGDRLRVFTGDAGIHLTGCLRAGAVGNVPGIELTDRLVGIYDAWRAGDDATADAGMTALLPYLVFALQGMDHYNLCAKTALVRLGVIAVADLRPPAPSLSAVGSSILAGCLDGLGIGPRLPASAGAITG